MRLITELLEKYPGLAKSHLRGSRGASIRLFCLECCGGIQSEVRACTDLKCTLWRYRMGGGGPSRATAESPAATSPTPQPPK